MANEIDEHLKKLQTYKGVIGIMVINSEGIPIKSSMEETITVHYAGLVSSLAEKSRGVVRDLDPANDLVFIRLRSNKHEIMIAPDKEFILTVVQTPTD